MAVIWHVRSSSLCCCQWKWARAVGWVGGGGHPARARTATLGGWTGAWTQVSLLLIIKKKNWRDAHLRGIVRALLVCVCVCVCARARFVSTPARTVAVQTVARQPGKRRETVVALRFVFARVLTLFPRPGSSFGPATSVLAASTQRPVAQRLP